MPPPPLFVLFLLLLLLLPPLPQAKLILTYFILRHGARNALPKTSTLQESGVFGGPTLLPQGKKQAYEVGQAFRARYLDPATCQQTDTCLTPPEGTATYGMVDLETPDAGYSNYNTMINSSALHRTELTAGSFLLGAFLDPQQEQQQPPYLARPMVPVFNAEDGQDWRIRSYTKCPAYDDALEKWFTSAEFKQKETETQALRNEVQQVLVGGGMLNMNASLATWWNVYDRFNVWKTYKLGDAMPDIDDSLYEQVVELGMWLETSKMRSSLAGNKLGGGLVADMLGHIEKAVKSNQVGLPHYKLLGVVGHYNTQLGLLAALKADQVEGEKEEVVVVPWLTQKIPSPAAILTFELHTNDTQDINNAKTSNANTYAIRAVRQDGAGKNYQPVPLPCSVGGKEEGYPCPLPAFLSLATPQAMNAGEWCEACENVDMLACQAAAGQRSKGKSGNNKRKYHLLR